MEGSADRAGGFAPIPGRFRLQDIRLIIQGGDDYRVKYAGLGDDRTPLFAVYRRTRGRDTA